MPRIIALDYGKKRVGVAVTDDLQIVASGLTTLPVKDIIEFLEDYINKYEVSVIVIGLAVDLKNNLSESAKYIEPFVNRIRKMFPTINIERVDERFTSKMAFQTMIDGGLKKKARQNKELIDKISATIILQSYLEQQNNFR
ncbi:MAG TPA: Holliday junction resolvase RuvX [Vicingaceae bacterium]|nr:Holliday junction resolvase RuvX [Vicingaceae bacterium]